MSDSFFFINPFPVTRLQTAEATKSSIERVGTFTDSQSPVAFGANI